MKPSYIDRGYAFVVLCATFLTWVIMDGICFSFGFFYVELLDYFGDSRAKTSWIYSLYNGLSLSIGPLAGGLVNRFGCRAVTIAGSVLTALALATSTLAPSVGWMIAIYGLVGGFGFGLLFVPTMVMAGLYFDKRRALATGITAAGAGVGALIFAPLTKVLIDTYDWKGAMLLMSGAVLQVAVCGSLFRPIEDNIDTNIGAEEGSSDDEEKNLLVIRGYIAFRI